MGDDVETLYLTDSILKCKVCGGEWLNEGKFKKHLTKCAFSRSVINRGDHIMTKEDLIESEDESEECDTALLTCTTCDGKWIDETKFKKHIKQCFNLQKMIRKTEVKRTTEEKTTKPELVETAVEVVREEEKEVVKYSARGRRISRTKLYQAGNTTPGGNRSQINTSKEDIPGSSKSKPTLVDEETEEEAEKVQDEDDIDDNNVFFECEICMQMFVSEEKFTDHNCTTVETGPVVLRRRRYLQCQFCTTSFKSNEAFEGHMRKSHSDQALTCDYCCAVFAQRTRYDYHMEMHANKEAGISFECKPCKMFFYTEVQLKNHQNDKHNMQHFPYVCKKCGKAFRKPASLDYHLFYHSPSAKPFKCEKCPETFGKKKLFDTHMEIHRNQEMGTTEICWICGKEYLNKTSLKNHISFVHREADKMCEVCGKVFKNAEHLKRHRYIHAVVKPYKCLECGKDFAELSNLRKHSRIHSGLKPYKCDICGTSFNHNVSLKTHKKSTHGIDWWAENGVIKDLQKKMVESINKD